MRKFWTIALPAVLATRLAYGQEVNPYGKPASPSPEPRVTVSADDPGVTAPTLLPPVLPPVFEEKCKKKLDGKVTLSLIVSSAGKPNRIMFLQPAGTDIDKFALQVAAADQFTPGTSGGVPVAVAQSLELHLQGCLNDTKDPAGKKSTVLRLRSLPTQKLATLRQAQEEAAIAPIHRGSDSNSQSLRKESVGGSVSAPIPLIQPEAEFSDAARRAKYQGICLVSLIVDSNGMPQNLKVVRKLDYGLDVKAIEAVNKYRFKPAIRNGEPVSVAITVEVNFRLY